MPSSPAPLSAVHDRRLCRRVVACLAVATLLVYANSFSGPFIFDDFLSIPDNPTIRSFATALAPPGGGVTVTGRPVLNLSFAVNYAIGGPQVWSYHLFNLAIHAFAGLTLFGLVRRTLRLSKLRDRFANDSLPLAAAVAALWLLHPLQTESVTYLVQRAESLMGLFYLLTLYAFLRGVESSDRLPRRGWFALAVAVCLLGMGTKEVMVSAPPLVLLYDRTFLTGSFRAALRLRAIFYSALAATWSWLALLVLHAANRGGSAGFGVGVSYGAYLASQFEALGHYLWLTVWPSPLILDYGPQLAPSFWAVAPYAVVVFSLLAATAWALVRRPALGFLGASFFAILAPTSLVPVLRQTLAEHRLYLALTPLLVLIVLGLHTWLGRRTWYLVAAAAAIFGSLTVARNADYRSSDSIWSDTVAKRPGNPAAHNNYANLLAQSGRPEEALAHYEAAVRLQPDYIDAHYNAGQTLDKLGRWPEAIAQFEQTLQLDPRLSDAHLALGLALENVDRLAEAEAHYERALQLDPRSVDASNHLGIALARADRVAEAIARFEAALALDPARAETHRNLGNALRLSGRAGEAVPHYEAALRLEPDSARAHANLAGALRETDRLADASAHYEQALALDPSLLDVRNDLGTTLLAAGRAPEAVAQFEAILRANPRLGQVHLNLALALESLGRTDEAAAHYAAARQLGAQ